MEENVQNFDLITDFTDEMYVWILDPNSSPQSKRFEIFRQLQNNAHLYRMDSGVVDAYKIILKSPVTSYQEGQVFYFKASSANTGACTFQVDGLAAINIVDREGNPLSADDIPNNSFNIVGYDGTNFQILVSTGGVSPIELVDGANISFDFKNKFFDFKKLETSEPAITLTVSNVRQGANQIISIKKNIAGDVTLTLAGATFYGYNNSDLNTTPEIVLSGAVDDVFDISFLARTDSEIGIAIGINGN